MNIAHLWRWLRMTAEERELVRELDASLEESRSALCRAQKEHAAREEAMAAERRASLPEIRRKHEEWVKSLIDDRPPKDDNPQL